MSEEVPTLIPVRSPVIGALALGNFQRYDCGIGGDVSPRQLLAYGFHLRGEQMHRT